MLIAELLHPARENFPDLPAPVDLENGQTRSSCHRDIEPGKAARLPGKPSPVNPYGSAVMSIDPPPTHQFEPSRTIGDYLQVVIVSGRVQGRRRSGKRPAQSGYKTLVRSRPHILAGDTLPARCWIERPNPGQ